MTTFSELQCFNKLLLEKLERTQKRLERAKQFERLYNVKNENYNDLIECLDRYNLLEDVFCCNECNEWRHIDYNAFNESENCDCGFVCSDCRDKVHWCCDGCEAFFCRDCDKREGHSIYKYGFHEYCDECIVDVVKEEQRLQYEVVMEELIMKHNPERYYKTLHKQNYRDVINSIPLKYWCGKNIVWRSDCDVDTDSDAF
tara:strand:- start:689 stop:1288 length:600 start_codon:yes stop_codon:yes gene_type:complete